MIKNIIIWKTCRILANESRLRILKRLMRGAELCVTEIADAEEITPVVASQHLRMLHELGILKQTRKSKWTFYSMDAAPESMLIQEIHKPLERELVRKQGQIPELLKLMTAFTHPRRVEIIKQLAKSPRTFNELTSACAISPRAMIRHLSKLQSRNFIQLNADVYSLLPKGTALKKRLVAMCQQSQ